MAKAASKGVREAAIGACGRILLQTPGLQVAYPPQIEEDLVKDLVARMQVMFLKTCRAGQPPGTAS